MSTNERKTTVNNKFWLNPFFSRTTELSPSYFAMVMATGIVSIAAHLYHFTILARGLFYINVIGYTIICMLFIARFVFYKKRFLSDFIDDRKNMGFLSFVAANCILGSQFILIENNHLIATCLLIIGLLSWVFLSYSLLATIIVQRKKPSLKAISGTWLLLVVAIQAIAVLAVQLVEYLPFSQDKLFFFSLILFMCGCMFYIIVITLIIYRLIFFNIQAEDIGPPYWITMGADAITVLAASTLILNAEKQQLLAEILPFLKGFALLFWAIGTWWIPLMLILSLWRYLINKERLRYQSDYWGMVFPLGMYTVCTITLAQAMDLPFLIGVSNAFLVLSRLVCLGFGFSTVNFTLYFG